MRSFLIVSASAAALLATAPAQAYPHHRHHHDRGGNGAAVGAALGAGIFLGALAATAAEPREEVYIERAPPPPPPPRVYYEDRGEQANEAINACRVGLLDAGRKYGAYDAQIGDIYSVRETPEGHHVRAEITIDYPRESRTSVVSCDTEDGFLVSAHTED
jgi:opacity protein-like surface antigen